MEADIRDLSKMLVSGRPDVRSAAAALLAAQSSELAESAEFYKGSPGPLAEEVVRSLLQVTGDTAKGVARSSLSALVNLSSDERSAKVIAERGGCTVSLQSLLDPSAEARDLDSLHAGLLANLSRLDVGCKAALVTDGDESARLMASLRVEALVRRLSEPRSAGLDPLESAAMFVGNLAQVSQGRDLLLAEQCALLRTVVRWQEDDNRTRRLGAALALRNCAADDSAHAPMQEHLPLLGLLVLPFVDATRLPSSEDLADAPSATKALVSEDSSAEPVVEVRRALSEALLLMCRLRAGRDAIRASRVYPFLRSQHAAEEDQKVRDNIEEVVQRTELLNEDDPTGLDAMD